MALNDTLARMWGGLLGQRTPVNNDTRIVQEAMDNLFNKNFTTWGGGYTPYPANSSTFIKKGYMMNPDLYAVVNQMDTKMVSAPLALKKSGGSVSKYRSKYNQKKGMFYDAHDRVKLIRTRQTSLATMVLKPS